MLTQISIGSDPEVFISFKNKIVPSFDLIKGTKNAPRPLAKKGFFVQEDNVALEFNIPPCKTKKGFIETIHLGVEPSLEVLPKGFTATIKPSHQFSPRQLKHWKANIFGCEPDRNAWMDGGFNDKPEIPKDGLRSVGGHIHIGFKDSAPSEETNKRLVRLCDVFLGVPSMRIDKDTRRRELYGKAGAYRDKKFGVEYRTLSSFWLASKELTGFVFDQTQKAIKAFNKGIDPIEDKELITQAINFNDETAASKIITKYSVLC